MTYSIIILFLLLLPLSVLPVVKRIRRRRHANMLNKFNDLLIDHNLHLSGQECFCNRIFGIDGVGRKLLLLWRKKKRFQHTVIHLDEVKHCSLKKCYYEKMPETAGNLKSLQLVFTFKKNKSPVEIAFFKEREPAAGSLSDLESRAHQWEKVLTKMQTPFRQTA